MQFGVDLCKAHLNPASRNPTAPDLTSPQAPGNHKIQLGFLKLSSVSKKKEKKATAFDLSFKEKKKTTGFASELQLAAGGNGLAVASHGT